MISGYATLSGTGKFVSQQDISFRKSPMFYTSPIALGTHLGDMNEKDSKIYREGIEYGLMNGLNFIDTAINYRGMRSERDVGYVLKSLIDKGSINRDEIIVSTKGGIIPGDIEANLVPKEYLQKILLEGGIIKQSDLNIVDNHRHVLTPNYYKFAIGASKKHLNLNTIDIYYIHNPEVSMMTLGPELFYKQLRKLFSFMEEQVQIGNIKYYGLATWLGLINDTNQEGYISLEEVINTAKTVAGEEHHFRFIQFPLNKHLNKGIKQQNQKVNGKWLSLVDAAEELGVISTTSAPFNLGKSIDKANNPQEILLEVIQNKGIFSTMVGMKQIKHIKENIQIFQGNFQYK
ncbi:aldo/keto reductase [Rossellomorea sp. LJF3]|uniref:aldo/keto reductase n=1 Tax=Rossellomorea sp. LJF3 TaxID=3126099 RepID=UPI00300CE3E1